MEDIRIIDAHYIKDKLACCYFMKEQNQGIFIETNTNYAIPYLLEELENNHLKPEDVSYIIITHVHLDHAGGAGLLMQKCPNAILLAHPKAAKHVIDPSRLVASSIQVYGEENFKKLYGDIIPVPKERVKIIEDGEVLEIGTRKLKFIYTKGHANHHFVIYDSKSNGVFTGDSFGIAYPVFQEKGLWIFPSTTPTDFDPKEAKIAIDTILNTHCDHVYLTHFGIVKNLEEAKQQLNEGLDFAEELLQWCLESHDTQENKKKYVKEQLISFYRKKMQSLHLEETSERMEMLHFDADLNAMGIVFSAERIRRKNS